MTRRIAQLITVALAIVALTPSAFAMWAADAGCSEFLVEVVVPTGNCEDPTGEENNVCLEAAGFPVSTSPQLLEMIQQQREQEEAELPDVRSEEDVERAWSDATAQLEAKYTFQIVKAPARKPYELSCSVYESSCDEAPHTPVLELPGGHGFGVDPTKEPRDGFEPVSFDMSPQNPGISRLDRPSDVLVPPPDLG